LFGAAEFRAGVGRIDITPHGPIVLAGSASASHPSEGVVHPLWAKALALEDSRGGRIVIVTADCVGLPRAITDFVAARVEKEYALERARLLFNSSGTRSAPALGSDTEYRRELSENLFSVIGGALGDLAPAQIAYGFGQAHFAVNRRQSSRGPVDPSVPVVRVLSADGKLKALLFGYACRNAALPAGFNEINGDYAGFAQLDLEQAYPGAAALYLMLCGADQIPNPGGSLELAREHGAELSTEVKRVLSGNLKPLRGPLSASFQNIDLNFALANRASRQIQYPIHGIRFGKGLTLLALGGEVVVDYALSVSREYRGDSVVLGDSNDIMGYIPTQQTMRESAADPAGSVAEDGMTLPYANDFEDRIKAGIRQTMLRLGVKQK
jgi:hypothetical protein